MLINQEKSVFLLKNKKLILFKILTEAFSIKTNDIGFIADFLNQTQKFLITATVIDQPTKLNRFFLNYVFVDFLLAQKIYINTNITLTAPSLVDLYPSAIWLEREIFDMFGIYFTSHTIKQDLRRILTDYNFKGHPLRKDFTLIGYKEKIYSNLTKTIKDKSVVIY